MNKSPLVQKVRRPEVQKAVRTDNYMAARRRRRRLPKQDYMFLSFSRHREREEGEIPYHIIGKIPFLIGISPLPVGKRVLSLHQNRKKLFHIDITHSPAQRQ